MDNLWKFMFKNFVAIDVILFAVDSIINLNHVVWSISFLFLSFSIFKDLL